MTLTGFNQPVSWQNFRTVRSRPGTIPEDAFVKAKKVVSYSFSGSGRSYSVTTVNARIWVMRSESWVVQGAQNADLLKHEQGHYDITALGMREEASRVAEVTGRNGADISRQVNAIRTAINRKIAAANRRYDARTEHSRNRSAQQRWDASLRTAKASATGTIDDLPS